MPDFWSEIGGRFEESGVTPPPWGGSGGGGGGSEEKRRTEIHLRSQPRVEWRGA